MVRKFLLGCGIVSSVLYVVSDVLGSLRYDGYRYADHEFSELTAQGSSVRPLMIALNAIPYTLLAGAFAASLQGGRLAANRPTPWMGLKSASTSTPPCCGWRRWPSASCVQSNLDDHEGSVPRPNTSTGSGPESYELPGIHLSTNCGVGDPRVARTENLINPDQ